MPDGPGSLPSRSRFFSSPLRLDRLWGPPSLRSSMYRSRFPRGYSSRGMKLTTHLYLVPRSRMVEPYLHFPVGLYGIFFQWLFELIQGSGLLISDDRTPWTSDQPVERPVSKHRTTQTAKTLPVRIFRHFVEVCMISMTT
jgi:hypothetical protein